MVARTSMQSRAPTHIALRLHFDVVKPVAFAPRPCTRCRARSPSLSSSDQRVVSLAESVLLTSLCGEVLVAGILVVPAIMPLSWFILELWDGVSVEFPGLFWLQPTSAKAARTGIANRGIIDFISIFHIIVRFHLLQLCLGSRDHVAVRVIQPDSLSKRLPSERRFVFIYRFP